jgi:hypothetical protein
MNDLSEAEVLELAAVDTDTAQALREADEAVEEAAELERRVIAGDDAVALDDIDAAEKRGRFARLRAIGSAKRAKARREAERLAAIAELEGQIVERFASHDGDGVDLFDRAVAALEPLVHAATEHNAEMVRIGDELLELAPLPDDLDPTKGRQIVVDRSLHVTPIDLAPLLAEVAWRALVAGGADIDAVSSARQAAHVGSDRETAAVYGLADNADGTAAKYGPSDALRWRAAQLAESGIAQRSRARAK